MVEWGIIGLIFLVVAMLVHWEPDIILEVDYAENIQDIILAGGYVADPTIINQGLPAEVEEKGKKMVWFRLFPLNSAPNIKDVLVRMKEKGYRPATVRELLYWGKIHPKKWHSAGVVAPSICINEFGAETTPGIQNIGGVRCLYTTLTNIKWDPRTKFLGVKIDK
jgi:hypothetical protein